jgi:osmotically-inducible protein OsmY
MRKLRLLVAISMLAALCGCAAALIGGVGTAVAVAEDRRSVGTVADDKGIEIKMATRFRDKFDNAHFNITPYNRIVLLTGEVPDAATKSEIEKLARGVENVRGVHNELAIAGKSSVAARANDTFLTGKVKTRFVDQKKFNPLHVKVVTEANVAYLLGLVTHKEGDDAAEIARTTGGVQKVVKLFEYTD